MVLLNWKSKKLKITTSLKQFKHKLNSQDLVLPGVPNELASGWVVNRTTMFFSILSI